MAPIAYLPAGSSKLPHRFFALSHDHYLGRVKLLGISDENRLQLVAIRHEKGRHPQGV